jgi:RimJ/RimL family protein N-acetyltransferase
MRFVGRPLGGDAALYREHIRSRYYPYYARFAGYGYWAVVEGGSGAFLGWFHLRPALDYRFAAEAGFRAGDVDLGYRLQRSAWGKGYATEGARALVHKEFSGPGAARVVACALAGNTASIRVMDKAGLKLVSPFLMPEYGPAVTYALSREEFDFGLVQQP